jgi:TRAP-type C4-dicarboxylate transport system permease small subunit
MRRHSQTAQPCQCKHEENKMNILLNRFYQALMALACISMLAAFVSIMLGVAAREFRWDIQGLDAYAGYSIAAALFLALPSTLRQGDHIRVTLLMQRLSGKAQNVMEHFCLALACAISAYVAWYACRLVWVSIITHDISPGADASPLWIPQISMALGCIGFFIAFLHGWVARIQGNEFFVVNASGEMARTE